ncbi:SBBP repeat-containing protein [Flavobacterium sp. LS1R49]|uniref:SBBP repeat-containing protein n=1 Tax=Flavobacterium shii TaxID=2987687 RepID=A0A9X2ZDL7_9FLAO|nr:SBBP repeat-containing protein [Flavobacterium shii]MCV9928655.1 SBBP repeat-containing protein [Flavobacterium shii]
MKQKLLSMPFNFPKKINYWTKTSLLLLFFVLLSITKMQAQDANLAWAKTMGSPSTDLARGIAVDAAGNVYTTGYFTGTVDFDPGAGVFNLIARGANNIFITKLDAAGNFVWAKSIGGSNNDMGNAIAVDATGNVYVTGTFFGTIDFDPNAGVYNLTSNSSDIFVLKLDTAGNLVWAKAMGGAAADTGYSISVDAAGNVYATGSFFGTADFDPNIGVSYLTSAGSLDIFVVKLDAAGNLVWAKALGGIGLDSGQGITTDAAGNVYTTGYFNGTADLDPGIGVANFSSMGDNDIFVVKLDVSGNLVWAKTMGGTGADSGNAISVDTAGNVYTTGSFFGTVDFDPGAGILNLTSMGSSDIFISKLDVTGNLVWAKSIGSTRGDIGYGITTDLDGNVFTTGYFQGTVDFDPNAGVSNFTSVASADVFVLKLDETGNFAWTKTFGGSSSDIAYGISVDTAGNVYTAGSFYDTVNFDPNAGVYNLTSVGVQDIFIHKMTTRAAALNFDGVDDLVSIPNNSVFNFGTSDFSVESWIKTTNTETQVVVGGIQSGDFWLGVEDNKAVFSISGSGVESTVDVNDGQWHHIAGVRNSGIISIYVDGILSNSIGNNSNIVLTSNDITIGSFSDAYNFNGDIDEVRIWNRALIQAEIQNTMNCELGANQRGLLAYYKFNQGSVNTNNSAVTSLKDSSGNNNTGNLFNFSLSGSTSNWITNGAVISGSECIAEPSLSIIPSQIDVTCSGGADGSATVVVSGGYAPYSYSWSPSGGTAATASGLTAGTYDCLVRDASGSTLIQNFVIIASPASPDNVVTIAACTSYFWENTGLLYTTSGIYTGTTTNCVTEKLNLTIGTITSNTTTVSAVGGYTWTNTGFVYEDSGIYTGLTTNCITEKLDLTIIPIDVTSTVSNGIITASQANATYQWYNCDTNLPIVNETSQSFTPTVSGNYAAHITINGFDDFSDCVAFTTLGVDKNTKIQGIRLHPNPSTGIFNLELTKDLDVEVYNNLGQKILSKKSFTGTNIINISEKASGVYFLKVIDGNNVNTIKLIKK